MTVKDTNKEDRRVTQIDILICLSNFTILGKTHHIKPHKGMETLENPSKYQRRML